MKPLVLRAQLSIPQPPHVVWEVLVDVPTWPQWCPPVRRVTRFTALEVGQRVAYVLSMGPGVPVSFDVELQVVDVPRRLQWTSTKWWG
ncbi:MAG: SRPBCC family protein, partial [Myxococcota bacterium]